LFVSDRLPVARSGPVAGRPFTAGQRPAAGRAGSSRIPASGQVQPLAGAEFIVVRRRRVGDREHVHRDRIGQRPRPGRRPPEARDQWQHGGRAGDGPRCLLTGGQGPRRSGLLTGGQGLRSS
jgi:hypothetical protein